MVSRNSGSRTARRLAAAFPNPPGFVEVPGAGHADVVAIGGDALLERILQFLQEATVLPRQESFASLAHTNPTRQRGL